MVNHFVGLKSARFPGMSWLWTHKLFFGNGILLRITEKRSTRRFLIWRRLVGRSQDMFIGCQSSQELQWEVDLQVLKNLILPLAKYQNNPCCAPFNRSSWDTRHNSVDSLLIIAAAMQLLDRNATDWLPVDNAISRRYTFTKQNLKTGQKCLGKVWRAVIWHNQAAGFLEIYRKKLCMAETQLPREIPGLPSYEQYHCKCCRCPNLKPRSNGYSKNSAANWFKNKLIEE